MSSEGCRIKITEGLELFPYHHASSWTAASDPCRSDDITEFVYELLAIQQLMAEKC